MPLAMELTMELSYPASEGVVGGFTSIWFNISTGMYRVSPKKMGFVFRGH